MSVTHLKVIFYNNLVTENKKKWQQKGVSFLVGLWSYQTAVRIEKQGV